MLDIDGCDEFKASFLYARDYACLDVNLRQQTSSPGLFEQHRDSQKDICLGFCREPQISNQKKLSCRIKVQ